MATAVEGAQVDFETASRIESRHFAALAAGRTAKDMIQAFFFDMQAVGSGSLRPQGVEKHTVRRGGVLGAGIAYACATRGLDVVLKDVSAENAEHGKRHTATLLEKKVKCSQMTQDAADEILARITPTADADDLTGCDVVIEAVFENSELKTKVFAEAEQHIGPRDAAVFQHLDAALRQPGSRSFAPAGFHRPALLLVRRQDEARRDHRRQADE